MIRSPTRRNHAPQTPPSPLSAAQTPQRVQHAPPTTPGGPINAHIPAYTFNNYADSPLVASPSKARAQQRLTAEIGDAEAWLEDLFKRGAQSVPQSDGSALAQPFGGDEKCIPKHLRAWKSELLAKLAANEGYAFGDFGAPVATDADSTGASEVLQWLQRAQLVDRRADELQRLLVAAKQEEVQNLEARRRWTGSERQSATQLLEELRSGIEHAAQDSLMSLVSSAGTLGLSVEETECGDALLTHFMSNINEQSSRAHALQLEIEQLEGATRDVAVQVAQHGVKGLAARGNSMRSPEQGEDHIDRDHPELDTLIHSAQQDQTARWNREAKQISAKISEYSDRVSGLERQIRAYDTGSKSVVEDVLDSRQRVEHKKRRVATLEAQLAAYGGLPPDLAASRQEVRRATEQLASMKARRESLFLHLDKS